MGGINNIVKSVGKAEHDIAKAVTDAIDAATGKEALIGSRKVTELPNGHLIVEIDREDGRHSKVIAQRGQLDLVRQDNPYNPNHDYGQPDMYNP